MTWHDPWQAQLMIGALQVNPDMIGEEQLTLATLRQGLLQVWWTCQCVWNLLVSSVIFYRFCFVPLRFFGIYFVIHPRLCFLICLGNLVSLKGSSTFAGGFLGSLGKHGIWAVAYCYGTTGQGLSGGCWNVLQSIEAESSSTLIGWTGWTGWSPMAYYMIYVSVYDCIRTICIHRLYLIRYYIHTHSTLQKISFFPLPPRIPPELPLYLRPVRSLGLRHGEQHWPRWCERWAFAWSWHPGEDPWPWRWPWPMSCLFCKVVDVVMADDLIGDLYINE